MKLLQIIRHSFLLIYFLVVGCNFSDSDEVNKLQGEVDLFHANQDFKHEEGCRQIHDANECREILIDTQ